jgi:hypothetical protein
LQGILKSKLTGKAGNLRFHYGPWWLRSPRIAYFKIFCPPSNLQLRNEVSLLVTVHSNFILKINWKLDMFLK